MKTLTAGLAPCLLALVACSGSSSSAPSGPQYPTCTDSPATVFASQGVPGLPASVASAPARIVLVGETLYYFTPNAQDPGHSVDLQSITPWGEPLTVAYDQQATSGLWSDGNDLHWVTTTGIATQVPGGALSEVPSTLGFVETPMTNDATNVYAIESLELVSQSVSGGPVATLATFSSLGLAPSLYDGGDAVIVIDGSQIYSVPKDGSSMTQYTAPSGISMIWGLASPTSIYASSSTGELETYAFGGAVTPLWGKDALPVFTQSVATGANGVVAFSGNLSNGDLALSVASSTQPAAIKGCLDHGLSVAATLITPSTIYSAVVASGYTQGWMLIEWPTGG